ncbi:hypothetical protein N9777_00125 [Ascidiaceihabitans sp.]|nr:hypothetical protein [Ascidiaceihabitans sp.]
MANKLAVECLAVRKEVGGDRLFMKVCEVLGASSQTLEEAFLTAIRTRMAEILGRDFLAKQIRAQSANKAK